MDLSALGPDVEWPDSETGTRVRERLADTPELGHLAPLAEWWSSVRPRPSLDRVRLVLVGRAMTDTVASMAERVGASVREVEAGADGAAAADEEVDAGTDLLVVAVPGTDSDAATTVSVLTNTEPVKVLARGAAATDPDAWMDRAILVRDKRRQCMPLRDDADQLLAELASPRLSTAATLLMRAATRRTPVLLDGPVAVAAALIAYEAQPRAVRWWAAADSGPDPLQDVALTRLGQQPILGTRCGLGDGLAGLLAVPVVHAAAAIGA